MKSLVLFTALIALSSSRILQLNDILVKPSQTLSNLGASFNSGTSSCDCSQYDVRWPKVQGTVSIPVYIDKNFDANENSYIQAATMQITHAAPCIKFNYFNNEVDYVFIQKHLTDPNYCKSYVGRIGGRQEIWLGSACSTVQGSILHELLHMLGFQHMHSRPDRDNYITVDYSNVNPNYANDFIKLPWTYGASYYGTPYDYFSVMHYALYAGAVDGTKPTMKTHTLGTDAYIGNTNTLSDGDIMRLRLMYNC
jgi:hypothetical protein